MKLFLKTKKTTSIAWWIDNLIIAVSYFVLSALVLQLPQSQLGSPVWPPAGVTVGALLARGRSRWVGIFLGAALNSFLTSKVPFPFAIFGGLVPAIGALVSTTLVIYFNKTNDLLGYVKRFVIFALVVTFSGTLLQALLGALIVFWAGLIPWDIYWSVTWGWWVGDAIGVLLFAPLICAWWNKQSSIKSNDNPDSKFDKKELFLCLLILAIIFRLVLIENQPIEYFLLPPLLWSAFRFGAKITTLIAIVVAMAAAVSTAYKFGVFYKVSQESNSLIFLQLFMGVMLITTIAVLALVAENNRASEKLQEQVILKDKAYNQLDQVNKNLEDIIDERTKELIKANQEINSLNQRLTVENYRMSSELAVTRKLQEMILPRKKELNSIKELDIVGFMEPADEVGGDYYDVLQRNGRIKIGIGDVTGHGLESGVIMIMVQTAIRTLLINGEGNPVKFLSTVNQTIYENLQRMNCDKSLSLILMDYHDNKLYISGQHESVIVVRSNGEIEIIDTDSLGFPIGLTDEITEFIFELEIQLDLGDIVLLYTDGIPEAENQSKQHYGLKRLIQVISEAHKKPIDQIREIVINDVREFIGSHKVYDDITFMVMKRKI
ncbi:MULTISPECIES: SpoIIE family protein phosphatase [Pseudanabaena]|uniref:SpoIIE family protein phosphatase n=1 Tax=Pseudanabaena TaxID=1152 RepID=UPI0024783E64|nr:MULTISPECIES: MASE1 domain-containing protein [Pseudanabaena]MEA5489712.1 MASE1 domain-containing protein [Pseudanabaena sp. CCNP1317]WGS73871.1 MASE1 domain-containing protein [Pseudanabaena galeata CCNP1313]